MGRESTKPDTSTVEPPQDYLGKVWSSSKTFFTDLMAFLFSYHKDTEVSNDKDNHNTENPVAVLLSIPYVANEIAKFLSPRDYHNLAMASRKQHSLLMDPGQFRLYLKYFNQSLLHSYNGYIEHQYKRLNDNMSQFKIDGDDEIFEYLKKVDRFVFDEKLSVESRLAALKIMYSQVVDDVLGKDRLPSNDYRLCQEIAESFQNEYDQFKIHQVLANNQEKKARFISMAVLLPLLEIIAYSYHMLQCRHDYKAVKSFDALERLSAQKDPINLKLFPYWLAIRYYSSKICDSLVKGFDTLADYSGNFIGAMGVLMAASFVSLVVIVLLNELFVSTYLLLALNVGYHLIYPCMLGFAASMLGGALFLVLASVFFCGAQSVRAVNYVQGSLHDFFIEFFSKNYLDTGIYQQDSEYLQKVTTPSADVGMKKRTIKDFSLHPIFSVDLHANDNGDTLADQVSLEEIPAVESASLSTYTVG